MQHTIISALLEDLTHHLGIPRQLHNHRSLKCQPCSILKYKVFKYLKFILNCTPSFLGGILCGPLKKIVIPCELLKKFSGCKVETAD